MPLELGVAWSKDGIVSFRNKVYLSNIDTIPAHMFQNSPMPTEFILSDGVRKIGLKSFLNCTSLVRIHLPRTLTKIGPAAFVGCEQLKELKLPGRFGNWLVEMRVDDNTELEFYGELSPAPEDPFEFLISPQEEECDAPMLIATKNILMTLS